MGLIIIGIVVAVIVLLCVVFTQGRAGESGLYAIFTALTGTALLNLIQ